MKRFSARIRVLYSLNSSSSMWGWRLVCAAAILDRAGRLIQTAINQADNRFYSFEGNGNMNIYTASGAQRAVWRRRGRSFVRLSIWEIFLASVIFFSKCTAIRNERVQGFRVDSIQKAKLKMRTQQWCRGETLRRHGEAMFSGVR